MRSPCLNCGEVMSGRFCAACGQREIVDAERGLGHLLGDFFSELTSLESRTWRSLATLLLRPGELTRTWIAGARQRYLKPISVFLIANLMFFISPPVSDLNLPLHNQPYQPWAAQIAPWIEAKAAARAASGRTESARDRYAGAALPGYAALADEHAARSGDISKLLVILHAPFMALGLMLAFAFRRYWYAEHFVVALHQLAGFLLLILLANGVVAVVHGIGMPLAGRERIAIMLAIMGLLLVFFAASARRAYSIGFLQTLLATVLVTAGLLLGHFVYRFVQVVALLALL